MVDAIDDSQLRADMLAALAWQVELGADEAIADAPTDRTQLTRAPKAAAAAKRQDRAQDQAQDHDTGPAEDPVRAANDLAANAQSIEQLRDALLGYDGSPLKTGARNTVFADGNPAAEVMVIGEAPGRDEDREGKPFVGRSGQLLDRMLAAIGLNRASEDPATSAYITNVIFYRPLENRTPDDAEVQKLLPFTLRHIALAQPKVVLCVGNVPAKNLMQAKTGITRFRGSWSDVPSASGSVPALATFHPAYLLRQPDAKRFAWRDLISLREKLESLQ
ncbi:MAG: uracil-DNA glycosylase [Pseudomonadota bacterium]